MVPLHCAAALLVILAGFAPPEESARVPDVLELALSHREFGRARISYLRELQSGKDTTREYAETLIAHDSTVRVSLFQNPDGEVLLVRDLFEPDRTWNNLGQSIVASLQIDRFDPAPELRHLGIISPPTDPGTRYSIEEFKDELLIRAHINDSSEVRYTLRKDQGLSITLVENWLDENCVWRSIIDNARVGDRWFPSRVAEFHGNDLRPTQIWRIEAAEFETPNCPTVLRPEDIGVQVGTEVSVNSPNRSRMGDFTWDGGQLSTREEVRRRVLAGELNYGVDYTAEMERAGSGEDIDETIASRARRLLQQKLGEHTESAPPSANLARLWERDVADFISKYRLNRDQTQRAWTIHSDCLAVVRNWLRKHSEVSPPSADSLPRSTSQPSNGSTESSREFRQFVEDVLRGQLQPRLKSLLTRKQRAIVP